MKTLKYWSGALALALCAAGVSQAQVNTAYGQQAGASDGGQSQLSAFGYQALYTCVYCFASTAVGAQALRVADGAHNTAIGFDAMFEATSGIKNTAVGSSALAYIGQGNMNVGIGFQAGVQATANGSNNIWISNEGLPKDNGVIRIGTQGSQKFTQIAGIYNVKLPAGGGQALYVNSKGQIGVLSTTLHTSAQPMVTREEFDALKNYAAAVATQVHILQRDNAALKAKLAVR